MERRFFESSSPSSVGFRRLVEIFYFTHNTRRKLLSRRTRRTKQTLFLLLFNRIVSWMDQHVTKDYPSTSTATSQSPYSDVLSWSRPSDPGGEGPWAVSVRVRVLPGLRSLSEVRCPPKGGSGGTDFEPRKRFGIKRRGRVSLPRTLPLKHEFERSSVKSRVERIKDFRGNGRRVSGGLSWSPREKSQVSRDPPYTRRSLTGADPPVSSGVRGSSPGVLEPPGSPSDLLA